MYEINIEQVNGTTIVWIEKVKICFDNEQSAHKFLIDLLKDTGRIGY